MRAKAVEVLGEHGTGETAQFLKSLALTEKSQRVRDEAIESLGTLQDGDGVDALVDIARDHPDRAARRRAVEALLETSTRGRARR